MGIIGRSNVPHEPVSTENLSNSLEQQRVQRISDEIKSLVGRDEHFQLRRKCVVGAFRTIFSFCFYRDL